jgi:hypothetical protein
MNEENLLHSQEVFFVPIFVRAEGLEPPTFSV